MKLSIRQHNDLSLLGCQPASRPARRYPDILANDLAGLVAPFPVRSAPVTKLAVTRGDFEAKPRLAGKLYAKQLSQYRQEQFEESLLFGVIALSGIAGVVTAFVRAGL